MTEFYQSFRSGSKIVRIQSIVHPDSGEHYIIWSDIAHCFPGVTRIQNGDIFIPLLRNEHLFRVKPHGIKYYPDVILDVVYDKPLKQTYQHQTPRRISSNISINDDYDGQDSTIDTNSISAIAAAATAAAIATTTTAASTTTKSAALKENNDVYTNSLNKSEPPPLSKDKNGSSLTTSTITNTTNTTIPDTIFLTQEEEIFESELEKQLELMQEALNKPGTTLSSFLANVPDHLIRRAQEIRLANSQKATTSSSSSSSSPYSPFSGSTPATVAVLSETGGSGGENDWASKLGLGQHETAKLKSIKQEFEMLLSRKKLAIQALKEIELKKQDEEQKLAQFRQLHSEMEGGKGGGGGGEGESGEGRGSGESREAGESGAVVEGGEGGEAEGNVLSTSKKSTQSDDDSHSQSSYFTDSQDSNAYSTDEEDAKLASRFKDKKRGKAILGPIDTESAEYKYALQLRQEASLLLQAMKNGILAVPDEPVPVRTVRVRGEDSNLFEKQSKGKDKKGHPIETTANTPTVSNKDTPKRGDTCTTTQSTSTNSNGGHHNSASKSTLNFMDIVAHRGKEILAQHYDWLESPCPKMFIILPKDNEFASVDDLKWRDFKVHFLCDCGDLPTRGAIIDIPCENSEPGVDMCRCLPHVDMKGHGYPLFKEASAFGPYIMAILEMLEYGATVDGVVKMAPLKDLKDRRKVMYSMVFLMKQGIETSHQLLAKGYNSLDEIKPIAPLKEAELFDLCRSRINIRKPFIGDFAFMTLAGDIRSLCKNHFDMHTPEATKTMVPQFSNHPHSKKCTFFKNYGSLVVHLTSREGGRDFFRMVEQMVTTPVISVFLDWDLIDTDELELQVWIPRLSASCVRIHVPEQDVLQTEQAQGFGHKFYGVILAAIANKKIQEFSIGRKTPDDISDSIDEFAAYRGTQYMEPSLARFTRERRSPKVQLGISVTDLDKAATVIRKGLRGFGLLSKLTLEASYWDNTDHVNIDFGEGDEVEFDDTNDNPDYQAESMIEYFNKRENDTITVRTYLSSDTIFLRTHALKDVNIRINFPEDGPRIRELIKHNNRLEKMELSIECKDDPCAVFEYFKALTNNHPSLESFHLLKDWGKNNKSTFVWHGVSDRSTMALSIMSYSEDKIGPLLQKFGACLLQLYIQSINATDSAILEKVTRSRKGQLKLVTIALVDIFTVSQTALDELAKVLIRTPLQRFQITGTVAPRTTPRVADFMVTVASKITDIHLYGEHSRTMLGEMNKRMPESSRMDLLQELKIGGPFDATTKDLTWIRSLLDKPNPLSTIELHKVNLSHQGWMTLAQEVDFKRLRYFRIGPEVPLMHEAIKAFVMAVPAESELENFHLDSSGLKEATCLAYKSKLIPQLKKRTALVSIGRHF
ncbi:hypothetical protein BGZ76_011185 [Entomortierella beljakovae]|nr:hypothetical protein BGZ76_011185 [Entomortierella beljakovae]